jgi:Uma2 family endonuclease
MTAATYKWTLDHYHQAVEAGVFDAQPVELLKGELIVMPPEGEPHTYFSDRLSKVLQRLLGNRAQVREAKPIILPNDSQPELDIAVVYPLDTVYLEHHPYPENIFWLIEYSNTTLNKDLTSDISWSFPYPTLMLRIQRGLRNPWLLASQDEVTLTPPRALFTLDLMPHGRVRHSLLFAALPSGCPTGHSQTMLVLMVTGILDGDYTNSSNLTLLATRRQPHSLFECWSNLFGGWTPHHRDAHPKRMERGDSRLEAKKDIYAEAGIPEYWVVNLKDLRLIVFRDLTPKGYQTELTLTERTIAPIAFPDVRVEVKRLFSV